MKKLIIAFAALFMSLSVMQAEDSASYKYVTRDYSFKDFTGIIASSIYEVELVKSDSWNVSITFPETLEDYIEVSVNKGKLVLAMKQVPVKVNKNLGKFSVTAKVGMPQLYSLALSGAARLETKDAFNIGSENFSLDLSGAGKAHGLNISGKNLKMEMSGAGSASISGDFVSANVEMTGATKCEFSINAEDLDQELSGASKAYHNGDFSSVKVKASGASMFSFKGTADELVIDGSGAAKIETSKGSAKNVKANVSGASYCEVNAHDNLQVEASGGSAVRYVDNSSMKLDIRSVGRASSVSKLK